MATTSRSTDSQTSNDESAPAFFSGRINETGLRSLAFQQSAAEATMPVSEFELPGFPPWLHTPYKQITTRRHNAQVPHALLVHGAPGSGKHVLVEALAAMLLCENLASVFFSETSAEVSAKTAADNAENQADIALACGECSACRQLASGNHVDFRVLKPLGDAKGIAVDPTRDFIHWTSLTGSNAHGIKVGVIDSVDVMNKASANAILKTLEEPAAGSVLICIADWPAALPATITSRCQLLPVGVTDNEVLHNWLASAGITDVAAALKLAGGAPLAAIHEQTPERREQLAQLQRSFCDIVSARAGIAVWVERLVQAKYSPTDCLLAYLGFTADIIRVNQGAEKYCTFSQYVEDWKSITNHLTTEQWFTLLDRLTALYRLDNPSIKVQPVLETIFAVIWQQRSI